MRPRLTPPFIIAMIFFAVLFMLILSVNARAASLTCNGTEACIEWLAPTTWNDDTPAQPHPITTPIAYNVWGHPVGLTTWTLLGQTSATEIKIKGLSPGDWTFAATAVTMGVESLLSNSSVKKIRISGPTDGKIESPSDGVIEDPKH